MDATTSTTDRLDVQQSIEGSLGPRRSNTHTQLEMLVDFAEANRSLALGRLRSKEARQLAARLWEDVASRLNRDTFGPTRSSKEWTKVWNDLKCRVRAKLTANNTQLNSTGGGPYNIMRLSPLEERVANIIGRDCGPIPNVAQNPFLLETNTYIVNRAEVEDLQVESNESHNASMISLHLPPPTPSPPERNHLPVQIEPPASAADDPRVASTTAYHAVAETTDSTAANHPMASTTADQPVAPTASYQQVASSPTATAASAVPALQGTTPRRRRRPHQRRSPRAPTQTNQPTALSSLEESRAAVLRIEELRARTDSVIAESMLRNAETAKAQAEAAKTNAEASFIAAQALKSLADGVVQAINAVFHRPT